MKKVIAILFLIFSTVAQSQSLVDSLSNSRFSLDDSTGKALAELALKNPNLKMIDKQIDANKFEWQSSKASWLNNFNANFNLNEGNLKASNDPTSVFYPRYNFSLNLPLGNFITKGKQSKKTRAQYEEMKFKKEAVTLDLKETVLVEYQNYQMYKNLLALQEAGVRDETILLDQVEQRFKNNNASVEAYTAASKRLNDAVSSRITLMRNVNVSKYQLESLIGMKLEDALIAIKAKK